MSVRYNNIGDTFRDLLDSFTDREQILALFNDFLFAARPGKLSLLAIKGNSGAGKTFLLSYLDERICPELGWQTCRLSFAEINLDFRILLDAIGDALERCVPHDSFEKYTAEYNEFIRSFDAYHATLAVHQKVEAKDLSSIYNVHQNVYVDAQLQERGLQLRYELTRALRRLARVMQRPLCLFIDGLNSVTGGTAEVHNWFWRDLLPGTVKAASLPIVVVTCGWVYPDSILIEPFTYYIDELEDFSWEQVRSYLEKQVILSSGTDPDPLSTEDKELVTAFHSLTHGNPLVLGLAVTDFRTLDPHERTVKNLWGTKALLSEQARVEFLEERLLRRLSEPHRTLLEAGPILRYLDQASLQELLSLVQENENNISELSDRTYGDFLKYPFVTQFGGPSDDPTKEQPHFHELVRRVRLDTLRRHHPQTRERLHRKMADYYKMRANVEQELELARDNSTDDYAEWIADVPASVFKWRLEHLYHALQVKDLQVAAFTAWEASLSYTIPRWRLRQTRSLLEVVRQLAEEGEAFLGESTYYYARYLLWYSVSLQQEAQWEVAQHVLETARQVLEQKGSPLDLALCLSNTGYIYYSQGKLAEALSSLQHALPIYRNSGKPADVINCLGAIGKAYASQGSLGEALKYHEQALALCEFLDDPTETAICLNDMGFIFQQQGDLVQALSYHERSLVLNKQTGNPVEVALSLNNVGFIHRELGHLAQALNYFEESLALRELVGDPSDIANSLNNIAAILGAQGKLDRALAHFERASSLFEKVGKTIEYATTVLNIGSIFMFQGRWQQALEHFEKALALGEEIDNDNITSLSCNNIGEIYRNRGKLEAALDYHEWALALFKRIGNPAHIADSLSNLGLIYYAQGMLEQALDNFEQSLQLRRKVGGPAAIAGSLIHIGSIYQDKGDLMRALQCYEEALLFTEQTEDPSIKAYCLNIIGMLHFEQDGPDQALDYFKRSLDLREQAGNPVEIATALNNIGGVYRRRREWKQAIESYLKALEIYEHLGQGFEQYIFSIASGLSECYTQLGNSSKGLAYRKRARQIQKRL